MSLIDFFNDNDIKSITKQVKLSNRIDETVTIRCLTAEETNTAMKKSKSPLIAKTAMGKNNGNGQMEVEMTMDDLVMSSRMIFYSVVDGVFKDETLLKKYVGENYQVLFSSDEDASCLLITRLLTSLEIRELVDQIIKLSENQINTEKLKKKVKN